MTTQIQRTSATGIQALVKKDNIQAKIKDLLGKRSPQFCSTLVQIASQKHLQKATPGSILGAAITAATLDLPINQNLGFAHIVPYKDEAQFQMGYKGFIQLAQRTGQYKKMNEATIPKGVLQSYNPLTGELVLDWTKAEEGTPDGYAFYFELINGFSKTTFWSHEKTIAHGKKYSAQFRKYGNGNWKDQQEAMCLKTVIKHALSHYGILSVEMSSAMSQDLAVIDEDGNSEPFDISGEVEDEETPSEGFETAPEPAVEPEPQQ